MKRVFNYCMDKLHTDEFWAFLTGDLFTTCIILQFNWFEHVVHFAGILFVGLLGGFGGILGKRIFEFSEKKCKQLVKWFTRNRGI